MPGETMQLSDAEYAKRMASDPYHQNRLAMALRLLKRAVPVLRDKIVFDFGCGEGTFMRILAAEGATVAGSDPSQTLIDIAPEQAVVGSVETLEALADNSIDILIVLNVLGYVRPQEIGRFWRTVERVVRPGGHMLQGNANSKAAAGKSYHFMADPWNFPHTLRLYGFTEIGRDFHRYRNFPWTRKLTGKRDVIDMGEQDHIPMWLRARRSTGYFSLSRRTNDHVSSVPGLGSSVTRAD
jgi:SAM-dependent methyltransferase